MCEVPCFYKRQCDLDAKSAHDKSEKLKKCDAENAKVVGRHERCERDVVRLERELDAEKEARQLQEEQNKALLARWGFLKGLGAGLLVGGGAWAGTALTGQDFGLKELVGVSALSGVGSVLVIKF